MSTLVVLSIVLMFTSAAVIGIFVESKRIVLAYLMAPVFIIALLRVSAYIFGIDPA